MKQVTAKVVRNRQVMSAYSRRGILSSWITEFECPEIIVQAGPGQFVMVRCGEETVLRRPLSIHRIDGDRLALLYAVIGKGTQWLAARQPDDEVDILGPLGNGFTLDENSGGVLLVAGGMGIAPLYYLAEEAAGRGVNVTVLYGTATEDRSHVPSMVTKVDVTEDGSIGYKGMVTELVPGYLESADQVFACGPLPMYKAMADMPELKNRPVQVSLEMRMGCGFGVCYSCTVWTKQGTKQVCNDGPVFDIHDIIWEEIKI